MTEIPNDADRRYCICTAMLYDPAKHKEDK